MLKEYSNKTFIFYFFLIRIFYIILQIILMNIIGNNFNSVYHFMDSSNYLHIASYGYDEPQYYAFFPLIPALIKLFGLYGTVILNNVFCLSSILLLKKIFGNKTALLFLLSPIQIYCYIPYTESIFIFLTILSYYLYQKKKYLYLGLVLGIGVCCRNMMAMMFFSIFICMFYNIIHKKEKFQNILITYIPATIISCFYPIYLQFKIGNWKEFISCQYNYWDAIKSNLFKVIYLDIQSFIYNDFYNKYLIFLTYVTLFLLCFIFTKYKKIDIILLLYTLFTILITFSVCKTFYFNSTFIPSTSYFRYFLGCFSMYVGLSKIKNFKLIKSIFIILHILIACNFIINGWPF